MRIVARTALALAALMTIAACDRSQTPPPAAPAAPATTAADADIGPSDSDGGLSIEGEGLRIFDETGAARALPFGTPQATVIAAVAASTGLPAPEVTTNEECGQGPTQFVTFPNGLQLLFQNEAFNGWFIDQAGLTTVNGVGVGSTRAELNEAWTVEMVQDSTLGAEFSADDIGGFLTSEAADATVESLFAGGSCFFR